MPHLMEELYTITYCMEIDMRFLLEMYEKYNIALFMRMWEAEDEQRK